MSLRQESLTPDSPKHGTVTGYTNYKCRCEPCRKSWREYKAARIRQQKIDGLAPDDARHGTMNAYMNFSCRCNECDAAATFYRKARYQRLKAERAAQSP